ncbi:MAG TPA: aspartate/glutamate racemase family protein [Edaphobacter sp.]|nr:aspartate/glutamate racemase family protein [Edaphobacter sp.]
MAEARRRTISGNEQSHPVWGVVGGMGPLASAEFLKTIYESKICAGMKEQDAPIIVLYSDPSFPDRTECFLRQDYEVLLSRLEGVLTKLNFCNVEGVIICCMTMHGILERLPDGLRRKVVSLVDVVFEDVLRDDRKHLLICTEGSREMGVFERHSMWADARHRIVLPDDEDQARLHQMIFQIKTNCPKSQNEELSELLCKYQVSSFIAGCTEFHILVKQMAKIAGRDYQQFCIDPLMSIARKLAHRSDPR